MRVVSADEAVAAIAADDAVGIPLGPGQPPQIMSAMGRRDDWVDLHVFGALIATDATVFSRPGVRYLSGFFGPIERLLRDAGANIGFAPADFRGFAPVLRAMQPRVMVTAASAPDADGWYSLSLHAGVTESELHAAGSDPDRILIVESSPHFPRTFGLPGERSHALHESEIDLLVESDAAPLALDDAAPTETHRAIAAHARSLVPDGATLQTGIGAVPSIIATLLAEGDGGDYGIHSEVLTTGLMRLCQAGKVSNRKGQFDGLTVTTFATGNQSLYDWLEANEDVAFLPAEIVNAPHVIAANRRMVTINAALAVDIHGQVIADTIDGEQYTGIGGHQDFVSGPALGADGRSLLCLPSTYTTGGEVHSRLVPWFGEGAVITTPRHHVDVVITEHGIAELRGKTVRERGEGLAAIAAPQFRDGLLEAAERAANGRAPMLPHDA